MLDTSLRLRDIMIANKFKVFKFKRLSVLRGGFRMYIVNQLGTVKKSGVDLNCEFE
jgi:hypothetical protein